MACMVCVEYTKGNMTPREALRALTEVVPKDSEETMHKLRLEFELYVDNMGTEEDDE